MPSKCPDKKRNGCPFSPEYATDEFEQTKFHTTLFDLENNPEQNQPMNNEEIVDKMTKHMVDLMIEKDCPKEQFIRMGLEEYLNEKAT